MVSSIFKLAWNSLMISSSFKLVGKFVNDFFIFKFGAIP